MARSGRPAFGRIGHSGQPCYLGRVKGLSWGAPLTVCLVLGAGIAWLRARWLVVTVDGRSMQPTFADGQRLVVRRRGLDAVRRGDVVVLAPPPETTDGRVWNVKRVGALPGDPVPPGVAGARPGDRVPPGSLAVFGDNADSADSRQRGLFRGDGLLGVVVRPFGL